MRVKTNFKNLNKKFEDISGFSTGIIRNFSVYEKSTNGKSGLNIVTGSMPPYTKLIISPDHDMSYHISGYGLSLEEAYIRFIGESTERYASIISHCYLKDYMIRGSYEELSKQYELILRPSVHNYLSTSQLKKMHKFNSDYKKKKLTDKDEITWVVANSLKYPGKKVLIPASQFFVGFTHEGLYTPSFTTGCACHETDVKALINGIIEYIQIDAFMYHWYTDAPKYLLNLENAPTSLINAINSSLGNYSEKYDIFLMNYSDVAKVNIPIVGVFIIAKNEKDFPAISFGVQGGTNIDTTIYRGVQEALAVLEMNTFVPFNNPQFLDEARKKDPLFFDLDTNVSFYALPEKYEINKKNIFKHVKSTLSYEEFKNSFPDLPETNEISELKFLCDSINKFSDLSCYLNITPPDIKSKELNVARVFIPELLHMSFPLFPYIEHNRYKEGGRIIENIPHPLP